MASLASSSASSSIQLEFTTHMHNMAEVNKLPAIMDLHCHACSPTPAFTNTSHLLTHLASKAHLRTLFELELCATECGDEECAKSLTKFDRWYLDNKVGMHLVDRFIIKKGKWSRERANKQEVMAPQEGTNENPIYDPILSPQQKHGDANEPGFTVLEDKKRKRVDNVTPNRCVPGSNPETSLKKLPGTSKMAVSKTGRQPLASIMNEVPAEATYLLTGEQDNFSCVSDSLRESMLSSVKLESKVKPESVADASNANYEDETEIIEGPDRGVVYSPRGPRLRGKIWPGMMVFDLPRSLSKKNNNQGATITKVERPNSSASILDISSAQHSTSCSSPTQHMDLSPQDSVEELISDSTDKVEKVGTPTKKAKLRNITPDLCIFEKEKQGHEAKTDYELDADDDVEETLEFLLRTELPKVHGSQNRVHSRIQPYTTQPPKV